MLSRMPIRKKILCGTIMLATTLALLMWCSLRGVYAYRQLAQMLEQRADELPITSKLQREVYQLRSDHFVGYQPLRSDALGSSIVEQDREMFRSQLDLVCEYLKLYQNLLREDIEDGPVLSDRAAEMQIVKRMQSKLDHLRKATDESRWQFDRGSASLVAEDLNDLADSVNELPTYLQDRMAGFRDEVRLRYRTWFVFIWLSSVISMIILVAAYWFFRKSIVQPFRVLLHGSRTVARGNFEHRIDLSGNDELSELASALNNMTARFLEIRDNLNQKVQQRTREVVRSEQLASVGFLAAGVAHEINNPLASIAWSAEALEGRLHEILHGAGKATADSPSDSTELDVLRKYLKRIQDEAFRCKGITERLLDFSRLNDAQKKQATDVNELIEDVIALVQHLGQYRNKRIEFEPQTGLTACVSPPEFKQVVLNLLTNALDSMADGGVVRVRLRHDGQNMKLIVTDDGCGMSDDVLKHLFEPFFTRRRDGRGTGLGLSISYRIVQDHGGTIVPSSAGPGKGSRFEVTLPLDGDGSQSHEFDHKAAA